MSETGLDLVLAGENETPFHLLALWLCSEVSKEHMAQLEEVGIGFWQEKGFPWSCDKLFPFNMQGSSSNTVGLCRKGEGMTGGGGRVEISFAQEVSRGCAGFAPKWWDKPK